MVTQPGQSEDARAHRFRKPVEKGAHEVRFDREPEVGCLHEVGRCESSDFTGEHPHSIPVADVFDYGIRMDDIKLVVFETLCVASITFDEPKYIVVYRRELAGQIEKRDCDVMRQEEIVRQESPVRACSAKIQDFARDPFVQRPR